MKGFLKFIAIAVLAVIGVSIAFNLVWGILQLIVPVAILAGIGYVVYRMTRPKALPYRNDRSLK